MRDALTGKLITRIPLGDAFSARFGQPYAVTHRADIHSVILNACLGNDLIKLETSRRVDGFEERPDGVVVTLENGERAQGRALIGCDGMWSTIRERVVGDGKPRVSGHIAYRGVLTRSEVPEDLWRPDVVLWAGPRTHFVHYPLRRGELYNLVAVFHSDRYEEGWDTYGDPAELHARFVDKCEPVRTLLTKVNAWKMWVLCDRPPIKDWSKGRITLLGDAAHPMLQYLAQGGNMAMEDAVCLAIQIEANGGDYEAAFKKYRDLRYLRTARVQLMARVFGEIYHASGVNRELRNKLLREWSEEGSIDMSWLYGEQPGLPHVDNVPMPPPTTLASAPGQ
jgi:salicylate hydroxylase